MGYCIPSASELLVELPTKLELLNKIHNNPSYYAGYVTRKIVGNLSCNGSTPAEQSHTSIVSFKGEHMLTSVCEHIKSLLERQQQLSNKDNEKETEYVVRSHRYTPELEGVMAQEETIARGVLSQVPHKKYYIEQLKKSELLQCQFDAETMKHRVWPANDYFDNNKRDHVAFGVGMRCPCWRSVDFSIQCKHDLTVNIKFKRHHWAHRWYNRSEFNRQFPQ